MEGVTMTEEDQDDREVLTVMIDHQKVIEVRIWRREVDGDEYIVLDVDNTLALLGAWRDLDPRRRNFSWPAKSDYEDLVVAWHSETAGLVLEWVSPFWDGTQEWDAHSLEAIAGTLPAEALQWGEKIGEPAP
jgi:hypothetical protein